MVAGAAPGFGLEHLRARRDAGAAVATAANFDENSPSTRWELRCSIKAERGGVPEERRPAVAEQHLVAVGQREQIAESVTDAAHDRPDTVAAVTRAEVAVARSAASAATDARRAPSTGRSRSDRRSAADRREDDAGVGIRAGAVAHPRHDNGCPRSVGSVRSVDQLRQVDQVVASNSSNPRRRQSTSTVGVGHGGRVDRRRRCSTCRCARSSEMFTAAPAVGANAYMRSTCAPAANTGTGAPGTLVATKSQHFNMPPKSAVVVEVGSRFSTPASALDMRSAGSARQLRTSTPTPAPARPDRRCRQEPGSGRVRSGCRRPRRRPCAG